MKSRHNTVIYLVVELKKIEIKVNQNRKEMSSQRNLERHPPTEELSTIVKNRIQKYLLENCCCDYKIILSTLCPFFRRNNRIVFKSNQLLISNLQMKFRHVINVNLL